jgi:hypothetical protein
MTRSLRSLGDRMLASLAPKATAKGGCPPDCVTQTKCEADGVRAVRTCCYSGNCTYHCGAWVGSGRC